MIAKRFKLFRSRRGSLWFVATLLLGSAIVRVLANSETFVAFAAEPGDVMAGDSEIESGFESEESDEDEFYDLDRIIAELMERQAFLDEREAILDERIAALRYAEEEIQRNLDALKAAEDQLKATMAIAVTAAEDDLTRLTAVYENMKPKEAATLFEEMSPEFAAGFLSRMRPDAAAAVMAGLEPPTAYSISVIMAGRNANAPTE